METESQKTLLNTVGSHWALKKKRAQRAKELAPYRKPSAPIQTAPESKSEPTVAVTASAPVRGRPTLPRDSQIELSLLNESRYFTPNLIRCPCCWNRPFLQMKPDPDLPRHNVFRVICSTPSCAHPYDTDWFPNSETAKQLWRTAIKLASSS